MSKKSFYLFVLPILGLLFSVSFQYFTASDFRVSRPLITFSTLLAFGIYYNKKY